MMRAMIAAAVSFSLSAASSFAAGEPLFRSDIEDQSVSAYIQELAQTTTAAETKSVNPLFPLASTLTGLLIPSAAAATSSLPEADMALDGYEDR